MRRCCGRGAMITRGRRRITRRRRQRVDAACDLAGCREKLFEEQREMQRKLACQSIRRKD